MGISKHCILTLHRQPKQHMFTFSWLPFETNSLNPLPLSIVYFTYFTQLFQQSQVTSHLVTISLCKTLSEQILTAAKGHSSAGNFVDQQNYIFVDIHDEWSCTLQGHSSSRRLWPLHLHNLFLLIGLPLQEMNEDLSNKRDTDLDGIAHLQVIL